MGTHTGPDTIAGVLRARAEQTPDATAFFVEDGGTERPLGYAELDARARAVAAGLRRDRGRRALLVYPPGADYLAGFFGCLYAGVIAVPVYPPTSSRGAERTRGIAVEAQAELALTDPLMAEALGEMDGGRLAASLRLHVTGGPGPEDPADIGPPELPPAPGDVAFLQYTSGSTGAPKGVVLGHDNLMHNVAAIARAYRLGPDSVGVSWLPPYHDMGLIGGILAPVYGGFPCVLLSPLTFLRDPGRWLEVISRYRATISVAPDFGYAECTLRVTDEHRQRLDLRSWRHALVGAEPVRAVTLDGFAARFAGCGFDEAAFRPCYGLAEGTLFVTGSGDGRPYRRLRADRAELAAGRFAAAGPDSGRPAVTLVGCGHPHSDDVVEIVDGPTGRRCRPGTVGEVWVGGPTVARGYWRRTEETATTFGARIAGAGPRPYGRTGDLGFRHDGDLYIVGRVKDLIVVRGRNHHPADLEETVREAHPALRRRGAVFGHDDGERERVIVVHEAPPGLPPEQAAAAVQAIRAALAAGHGLTPDDVALVRPGAVPYTTSGKPRRGACRERYLSGRLRAKLIAAGGENSNDAAGPESGSAGGQEAKVAKVAGAVLGVPAARLTGDLPLIAAGLDSLRAVRLRAALAAELGLEAGLDLLLSGVSAAGLAQAAARAPAGRTARGGTPHPPRGASGAEPAPLVRHEGTGPPPASFGQQRMWLLDQVGAAAAYAITGAVRLRGRLDLDALRAAVRELTARHEALRTVVRLTPDGTLVQHLLPDVTVDVPVVDLPVPGGAWRPAVDAWSQANLPASFALDRDVPLRAAVLRLAGDDHVLVCATHHGAADGWSAAVLLGDLAACYQAFAAGRTPPAAPGGVRYADYARWQHDERGGGAARDRLAYWRDALAGVPALELPVDRPRSAGSVPAGGWVPFAIPAGVAERARKAGESVGATPFMVLLAAFGVVLARWSGQPAPLVAVPVAHRHRAELDDVVGFVADTFPLPVDVTGDPAFRELLGRVRGGCLTAFDNAGPPFELIARESDAGRLDPAALLRAALVMSEAVGPQWAVPGLAAETYELPPPAAAFELALHLAPTADGGFAGSIRYAADLFDEATVRRFRAAFTRVLERAIGAPDTPVAALPLTDAVETALVTGRLSGAQVPPRLDLDAIGMFERQAARTPDAPAISGAAQLSYRELDERANRLAWRLREAGVEPERLVGVRMPHTPQTVIALLAIWKAGGAYLPLDVAYPEARIQFMIDDARPFLVLGPAELADADADAAAAARPAVRPPRPAGPGTAAYQIYTSGSTGVPKGIVNTHAALGNHLASKHAAIPLGPGRVMLHRTPLGFDISITEIIWPLTGGACLAVPEPDEAPDLARIAEFLGEQGITDAYFVPSVLRTFVDLPGVAEHATGLRRVLAVGEELTPALVAESRRVLPAAELYNTYGPAEACIEVTMARVLPGPDVGHSVTIGKPMAGARIYVLDPAGRPAPIGVVGELCIGGVQVGRGYHDRPALTADRFRADPFDPGGRLYRTGDLARWRPDGTLGFLGRADRQVKINGNRVELGEIEHVLAAHPDVHAAVVEVRAAPDGQPRLVAYVTFDGGPGTPTDTPPEGAVAGLRGFLAGRLPGYMVPAAFVPLSGLPLNSSGKVDRAALPVPDLGGGREYAAPRTAVERTLAGIWTQVLGVPRVGRHDDFAHLGGHSLLAAQVAVRVHDAFGFRPAVADLLRHRTLADMAGIILRRQLAEAEEDEVRALIDQVRELPDTAVRELVEQGPAEGRVR